MKKKEKLYIRDEKRNHFTPQRFGYQMHALTMNRQSQKQSIFNGRIQRITTWCETHKVKDNNNKNDDYLANCQSPSIDKCSRSNYQHRTLHFKCNFSILGEFLIVLSLKITIDIKVVCVIHNPIFFLVCLLVYELTKKLFNWPFFFFLFTIVFFLSSVSTSIIHE